MTEDVTTDAQAGGSDGQPASKLPVIIGLIVLVALAGGYMYWQNMTMFTRTGTVTFVDVDNRIAELEMADPDGGSMTKPGTVPMDCEILIDGKPAKLEDIKIGDKVTARLEYRSYKKDGEKIREWIVHKAEIRRGE